MPRPPILKAAKTLSNVSSNAMATQLDEGLAADELASLPATAA